MGCLLSAYQVGSTSDDVSCSGGAVWSLFDHPLGATNTGFTWGRKSVFVFFTPVGETLYPGQQKMLWECTLPGRHLFSPAEQACKVPVHLPGCPLPPMLSFAFTGVTRIPEADVDVHCRPCYLAAIGYNLALGPPCPSRSSHKT